MTTSPHIGIIVSTTREGRVGRDIADAVAALAPQGAEIVDLREVALPFLDEPKPPRMGDYTQETTRRWAQVVDRFDGFVIVLAEYNAGYPAPLKNALDSLYAEWNGKPVLTVGYGFLGGARAVAALAPVLANVELRVVEPSVELTFAPDEAPAQLVERNRDAILAGLNALEAAL